MGDQYDFEQLAELPPLKLGDEVAMEDGSKYVITAIVSSIYMGDKYPVLIFECSAAHITTTGGN